MHALALLAVLTLPASAQAAHEHGLATEPAAYLSLATGRRGGLFALDGVSAPRHPWPVKVLSIGHTMASFQNYGGGASESYWHHGIDIRAEAGAPVVAAAGGKVVAVRNYIPGNDLYWEVAVLDAQGFLWQYHHLDARSIPSSVREALKSGRILAAGEKLGAVVRWPVTTYGERYHHIHLNVLGEGEAYLNPFAFLAPLEDHASPKVGKVMLTRGGRELGGARVRGAYGLAAEVSDLVLSPHFIVPPYSIAYSLDGAVPVTVWTFDRLPGGASIHDFVNDFFVPELTCGDYGCRRLIVDLSFSPSGPRPLPSTPGPHQVTVEVRDFEGNAASKSFEWTVEGGSSVLLEDVSASPAEAATGLPWEAAR